MQSVSHWTALASPCLFCTANGQEWQGSTDNRSAPTPPVPWYDRPVATAPGVGSAIPGVGAFVPGYVLISPAAHKSSIQDLPRQTVLLFLAFVASVVSRVEAAFGPATIFEHGSCRSDERRRSACITHSHLHVLPGSYSFNVLGLPTRTFRTLREVVEVPQHDRADGYLMYREPGGLIHYAPDAGISQYFRRHIARVLGQPDEWDYALFPRWPNVRLTLERLSESAVPDIPAAEDAAVTAPIER